MHPLQTNSSREQQVHQEEDALSSFSAAPSSVLVFARCWSRVPPVWGQDGRAAASDLSSRRCTLFVSPRRVNLELRRAAPSSATATSTRTRAFCHEFPADRRTLSGARSRACVVDEFARVGVGVACVASVVVVVRFEWPLGRRGVAICLGADAGRATTSTTRTHAHQSDRRNDEHRSCTRGEPGRTVSPAGTSGDDTRRLLLRRGRRRYEQRRVQRHERRRRYPSATRAALSFRVCRDRSLCRGWRQWCELDVGCCACVGPLRLREDERLLARSSHTDIIHTRNAAARTTREQCEPTRADDGTGTPRGSAQLRLGPGRTGGSRSCEASRHKRPLEWAAAFTAHIPVAQQ